MELVILDDRMMEFSRFNAFDSLVWNERYQEPGDFQLRSYGIRNTLDVIREGLLVGIDKSDYVMQVTNIDTDVDSSGNEVVTVTGKTLEHIFAHRPAVPKISSVFAMDADHPDGWEFGFKDEEIANQDPFQDIIVEIVHRVDTLHYGRDELSYLSLPFQYYWFPNDVGKDDRLGVVSKSKPLTHYVVDRGATVEDVFAEMLPEAEMGIATLRPRPEGVFWETHRKAFAENPERPGLIMYYRPRALHVPPTFDYLKEDYTSESTQVDIDHSDILIQADEDRVHITGHDLGASAGRSGLTSRVKLREREKFNLSQHELDLYNYDMGKNLFQEYAQANTYSIETSGRFPYDYKRYALAGIAPTTFFLGDIVRLNLQEKKRIDVQVKEYIRTQDADGYREYPTFTPYTELGGRRNKLFSDYVDRSRSYNWN